MDDSLSQALIRLPKGAVRRLAGRTGEGIAVFEGQVWITQDGVPGDVIVSSGESHAFAGDGDVLAQAFVDTVLIHTQAGDRVVDGDRLLDRIEQPLPQISAYELTRSARAMRDAAVGRAIVRAAGAVASATANLLIPIARRLRGRLAGA
ncbi:MAG: DUF2917 domain-containing protein [Burkholderiaceae bacterium]|jgi:hypothetical protein|nr:DUF2917 domain-containing protein [Burkholderiaceae bacterium]